MSVGSYFGVGPATLEEWKAELGTDSEGTRPGAIAEYLSRLGLVVTTAHDMTIDDLKRFWLQGQPVICPGQDYVAAGTPDPGDSGHYLTVIGIGLGHVFCQDSSADSVTEGSGTDAAPGRVMIAADTWQKNWHDEDVDGNQYTQFGIAVGDELPGANDAEDPATPPADEGAAPVPPQPGGVVPGPGKAPPGANAQAQAAARSVLTDVLGRLFTKESKAAARAAKGTGFDAWLAEFYPKHRDTLALALAPAAAAVGACLGKPLDAAGLAAQIVEESRSLLRVAYDTQTPDQFRAMLATWPIDRAARTAEQIMGQVSSEGAPGVEPKRRLVRTVEYNARNRPSKITEEW